MTPCPGRGQLERLQTEALSAADRDAVEDHVEECVLCQRVLAEMIGEDSCALAAPRPCRTLPSDLRHRLERAGQVTTPSDEGPQKAGWPGVPGYEVLGELGRGGMGVVYKARHLALDREVALKVLLAGAYAGADDLVRFRREAGTVARLQQPNVVQVFEVGAHEGRPFLALEYVAGGSLEQRLNGTPMPGRDAAHFVRRLAAAVQAAHEAGVVHRDLKPANILLAPGCGRDDGHSRPQPGANWVPKVADFGLAKRLDGPAQTQSGAVVGTPSYMAPEQAGGRGREVGPRTDVYALGAVLYECLTGRPPFKAETALDTLLQVQHQEPVPPRAIQPKTPRDLETICLKCLEKESRRRYPTAAELADDLNRFLAGEPVRARPVGRGRRALKWARRQPAAAALVGVSALALTILVGGVVSLIDGRRLESALLYAQLQKGEADQQSARADEQRALARRFQFAAQMNLAQRAWEENRVTRQLELLREYSPPRPGEEDLRGFEWHYLWRLAHGERLAFAGHDAMVFCVAFSPDGRHVASAGEDRVVRVWEAATGKEVRSLRGHTADVVRVVFSPDGKRVASASFDRTARVWDVQTGETLFTLAGHTHWVTAVAFAADRLATAGEDMTVRVWDSRTGKETMTFTSHTQAVEDVAFSPDGRRVASIGRDCTLHLWDPVTGKATPPISDAVSGAKTLAWHPGGRHVAVGGFDKAVAVWDVDSGKRALTLEGHGEGVNAVAYNADGQHLASAGRDKAVKLWDAATGREVRTFRGHQGTVHGVTFSPDGRLLASAGTDGTVKLWDAGADQEALTLARGEQGFGGVAFSPDGRHVAAGGGRSVLVLDAAGGVKPLVLGGSARFEWTVAVGPANRNDRWRVASGQEDGGIQVWDAAGGRELHLLRGHTKAVNGLAFSPDGRLLASGSDDRSVKVWDAASGRELTAFRGHSWDVTAVAFSPDGTRLASASFDQTVKVWSVAGGEPILTLRGHDTKILGVAFSPSGGLLASWGSDSTIRLWDAVTGREVRALKGHDDIVHGAAFSPDGQRLASGSSDRTVKVWDVATGQETLTLRHGSTVRGVAFGPDGRRLASATFGGFADPAEVKVWDASPPPVAEDLETHSPAR